MSYVPATEAGNYEQLNSLGTIGVNIDPTVVARIQNFITVQ